MNSFKNLFKFLLILILCSSCFWQEKRWNIKIAKPDEGSVITDRNNNKITVWGLFVLENVKMSEERKEELKKKYEALSDEEKQKLKAQYDKAEDKGTFWDWLMGRPDLKGSIFCQGIKGKIWDLRGAENWAVYDVPLKVGKNEITCFYSEQTYSVSKKVTVYYQPNNNPPLANFSASPTTGPAPLNVHFDASASTDSDGTIASYEWAFTDGTTGTGKIINHTFTSSNNYAVKLTVKDNLGATATKTVNISVTGAANLPPIADFSATPTSGTIPLNVHFDASASSDFDGSIVSYEWKLGNSDTRTGKIFDYTYTQAGIFTVELKVKDNKGATATKTISIDAQPIQNAQPIADFFISPPFGEAPLNTSINASASHDPDGGNIVQYHFNFGDGQTLISTLPVVAHTYTIPNTYQVKLKVLDNEGVFSEEKIVSLTVALPNVMPVAVIKASSTSGFAPMTVHFDGRDSHDDDGSIASYQWTFPGGVTANTAEADFTFSQIGTFNVTLKVTSADSFTDTKSISIEINNDNIKPSLSFDPEDGTKLITNVPLITVFYEDVETGINQSSLSVILDGTDVTNKFQVSSDRATLQFTNDYPLPHGAHTFQITIADNNGNTKSLSADVSVDLGIIEQAYFVGHVQDINGSPIVGANVTTILNPIRSKLNGITDAQGNYKIPFTTAGNYQLQISKAGFTTSIRNVTAILARDAAVETAVLMVADTLVTPILASSGGNAVNSSGTISINIPAGALNSDIQFSSTQATTGIALTRPLPPLSHFTMAMDNQPSGTVFSTAADMSIANTLGFSPGTPVPYGIIDENLGLWVDSGRIGIVSNDGLKINFKADHFSQYDLNYPHDPKEDYEDTDPEDEDDCDCDKTAAGSRINTRNGSLGIDYSLPGVKRFGKTYGLDFTYQSSSAHPQALLQVRNGRDINRTLSTDYINARLRLVSLMERNFLGSGFDRYLPETLVKPSLFRAIVTAINADNIAFNTGSYEFNAELASVYTDGEYATASYFGGPAENPTGVQTLEPVQLGSELFSRVIVLNERYSPFGAGWTLNGQEKLAEDPEGTVVWTDGTGRSKIYKPLSGPQGGKLEKINLDGKNLADIHNMIYYKGYYYAPDCKGNVVYRIDLQGNSTIIAGNGDPQILNCPMSIAPSKRGGFFIADSGNARIVKVDPAKKIFKVVAGEKSAIGNPVWVSEDDVMAVHFITGDDIKILSPHNGEILTYTTNNGGYVPADLNNPTQIHYDRFGNLYVVDSGNNRIMKMVTATRKARPIFGGAELLLKKIKSKKYDPNEPQLNKPVAMSFDPVLKRYFILEESGRVLHWDGIGHQRLVVLDMSGNKIKHSFKKFNKENSPEISALAYSPESGIAYADESGVVITRLQNKTKKDKKNLVGEITYVSPTKEYSALIKKADGTFERLELDKTVKKYNINGLITDVLPLDGLNLHYAYGVGNRLATLTVPGGDIFTFEYGGSGHLDRVIDPAGRVTEFSVNSSGDLISIAAPNGDEKQFSYDPAHLMTSQTDELNRVTAYQFTEGKLTGQTYPGNRQRTIMPSSLVGTTNLLRKKFKGDLLPRIKPSDIKSTFTSPEGRTNAVEVDRFGAARAYINGLGKARYIERDSKGQAILETTEVGRIIMERSYDLFGAPISIIDRHGKTTIQYEPFFRKPVQVTDEFNRNIFITYNSFGKVQTVIDPRNGQTAFTYFAGGVPQTITDANSKMTTFEINSQGNTTAKIDALGKRTENTYDLAGNKTSITDPEGNITSYEYDLLNRLIKTTDANGGMTNFTYFSDGKLKSITNAKGQITSYTYGINEKVETITNSANQVETLVYDNDKNLIQKTLKDGSQISFIYDLANQLTKETYADNVIERVYSDDGLLERVTDNDSDIVMDYDDKQRIINVVQSNAPLANLEYGYNVLGLKTLMNFNSNMIKASYTHDPNQEVVSISGTIFGKAISWNRSLDLLNRPVNEGRTNGIQSDYSFDDTSRILSINNQVSQFDYQYSDNGNITQILETIEGLSNGGSVTKTHSYNYDASNRLTQADSYKNESFVMDLLGNIINQSQIYNNLNQLTEDQNYFYSYDPRGNLALISSKIGSKKIELIHNKQNLLMSVIIKNDGVNPAISISYKHDGLRRRIERAVVNHLEPQKSYLRKFIYDEKNIIAEIDENNRYVAGYLHGTGFDNVIAMVRDHNGNGRFEDNEIFYFTKDHLGSIRELTDKNGNVVQRYRYSAYGETTIEKTNPSTQHKIVENRYAFTGREIEIEWSGYFYNARYYLPWMKMFLSPDPIGFLGMDVNWYRYVKNLPIMMRDPTGLEMAAKEQSCQNTALDSYYKSYTDTNLTQESCESNLEDAVTICESQQRTEEGQELTDNEQQEYTSALEEARNAGGEF